MTIKEIEALSGMSRANIRYYSSPRSGGRTATGTTQRRT